MVTLSPSRRRRWPPSSGSWTPSFSRQELQLSRGVGIESLRGVTCEDGRPAHLPSALLQEVEAGVNIAKLRRILQATGQDKFLGLMKELREETVMGLLQGLYGDKIPWVLLLT